MANPAASLPQTCLTTTIDIPSLKDATPAVLMASADALYDAVDAFCKIHVPGVESISNMICGYDNQPTDACALLCPAKGEAPGGRLFPVVEAKRGSNEGFYCKVHYCRSQHGGFTGVTIISAKVWSMDEAQRIAEYLDAILCW